MAAMCKKRTAGLFPAYNLIRLLMVDTASQAGALPRQLSFKHTLQIWAAWSQRQSLSSREEETEILFVLIAQNARENALIELNHGQ